MLEYGVPYYEIVIKGMQYPNTIILFVSENGDFFGNANDTFPIYLRYFFIAFSFLKPQEK